MKVFTLIIFSFSCFAELKPLNSELINKIDKYRNAQTILKKDVIIPEDSLIGVRTKLNNLPAPYQKLPYYIWGLFKNNKKLMYISDDQIIQLKQVINTDKEVRGRLHDERNYCRIRMILASYEYSLAENAAVSKKKAEVIKWLDEWLKYRKEESAASYRFIQNEWKVFTKIQQKKIISGEWKSAVKPIKDYNRNFSGDKLLIKALKIKNSEVLSWKLKIDEIKKKYNVLHKKYLVARDLYNKAFFYLDEVPEPIALKLSYEADLILKDMFIFQAEGMRLLMTAILTDSNRAEYKTTFKSFAEKSYSKSVEKYYTRAKHLINLIETGSN